MAVEQGIVQLVQSSSSVLALCQRGGYWLQLPKDPAPTFPNWSWRVISSNPDIGLQFTRGLTFLRFQIDTYGAAALRGTDCLKLAAAIDSVLSGFVGALPDPEATIVSSCFGSDQSDTFIDSSRSYRRMLEYEIQYSQS